MPYLPAIPVCSPNSVKIRVFCERVFHLFKNDRIFSESEVYPISSVASVSSQTPVKVGILGMVELHVLKWFNH